MFRSEENLSRKLVRVEGQSFEGWGCSECAWVFNPSGPPLKRASQSWDANSSERCSLNFRVISSNDLPTVGERSEAC
jgi:hypothetical protein